jgi:hypothetical protein
MSIRSNASMAESLRQVGREQTAASQRGSRSPKKSLLSSRRSSVSKSSSPEKALRARQGDSPSPEKPSLALRARHNDSPSRPPNIITKVKEENEPISSPELSPEVRAFRRMGASHDKLSGWAEQLKLMEDRRDAKKAGTSNAGSGSGSSLHHRHPALRSVEKVKENTRDFSNQSWRCEGAARREQEATNSQRSSDAENVPVAPRSRHTSRTSSPNKPLPAHPQLPAPSGYKYASPSASRTDNAASLHVAVRRNQHVRSKSSVTSTGDEDEWTMELKRMESREKVRQIEELSGSGSRERRSKKSVGGSSGAGEGDGEGDEVGECGIGVAR